MEFTLFPTIASIAERKIVYAGLEDTVRDASKLMRDHNVSSVVVRCPQGICVFSVEDMLAILQRGGETDLPLAEIQLRSVAVISEHESVLSAMELLDEQESRYLVVVDASGEPLGISTYTNILSAIDPAVLIEKKTIGDLITKSEPVTFTPDWILEDVLCHLNRMEDSIIVVEAAIPIGIITTKDVFSLISEGQSTSLPLSEYMTSPVITTDLSTSIQDTFVKMKAHQIKRAVVVDEAGHIVGVVPQSQLISYAYSSWVDLIKHHAGELKELVAILEKKALILGGSVLKDPLTELGNRLKLRQRITGEMQRVRRYRIPGFAVVLIQINAFGKISQTAGRLAQDEVVKAIAEILRSLVRESDEAARWEEDTFAVLLPHTSLEQAAGFVHRVRARAEEPALVGQISVTISAGAEAFRADESEDAFFSRLEQSLALARHADTAGTSPDDA